MLQLNPQQAQGIISHMNAHHQKELESLVKHYGTEPNPSGVQLVGVDFAGLDISYTGGSVRVDFPEKATSDSIKDAIIMLCMSVQKPSTDSSGLTQEIAEFAKGFNSGVLATISIHGEVLATYAPIIHHDNRFYIYISEVAEHFASIKTNPTNIELLFLEDECKAKSILVRKRLRYRAEARFVDRESAEFEQVYSSFITQNSKDSSITMIKNMLDFHLIELVVRGGRYVKGFGQAYSIGTNGEITHIGGGSKQNPHKFTHK